MFTQRLQQSFVIRVLFTNWRIWSQLNHTINHPYFKHVQGQVRDAQSGSQIISLALLWGFVCLVFVLFSFSALGSVTIMLLPLWLMLFSSSYVMVWIYRIASYITRQDANKTSDMFSVIPSGGLFARLVICNAVLNHEDTLHWISLLRKILVGVVSFVVGVPFILALTQIGGVGAVDVLRFLLDILLLNILLYVEHMQSVVMGSLIAMMLPAMMSPRADAPGGTLLLYVMLQVLSYMVSISVVIAVYSGGQLEPMTLFQPDILSHLSLSYVLFLLIRECLVMILWRINILRYNEASIQ